MADAIRFACRAMILRPAKRRSPFGYAAFSLIRVLCLNAYVKIIFYILIFLRGIIIALINNSALF